MLQFAQLACCPLSADMLTMAPARAWLPVDQSPSEVLFALRLDGIISHMHGLSSHTCTQMLETVASGSALTPWSWAVTVSDTSRTWMEW